MEKLKKVNFLYFSRNNSHTKLNQNPFFEINDEKYFSNYQCGTFEVLKIWDNFFKHNNVNVILNSLIEKKKQIEGKKILIRFLFFKVY